MVSRVSLNDGCLADRDVTRLWRMSIYGLVVFISLVSTSARVAGGQGGGAGYFPKLPMTKRMYPDREDYFRGSHRAKFKKLFEAGASFWLNDKKTAEAALDYPLADQSLVIYVPDSYDGGPGWGAYLYTSPGAGGRIATNYKKIMEKHKLIYVAPNGTQNGSGLLRRMGLTLDALATARSMYRIDPGRIVVSGFSGGGTVGTSLGLMYPELFIGLVNHSSQYYLTRVPDNAFSKGYSYLNNHMKNEEIKEMTRGLAKFECRWAFVTGNKDKNYQHMLGVADNWQSLGLDARLFNQPGMGHTLANADFLDQMLTWIEDRRDQAAVAELQTLKNQRQGDKLLARCRQIISSAPEYQAQFKEAMKIMEMFKELAEKKAQYLLESGTNVKAMIQLDSQWPQLPSTEALKIKINEAGQKYAEKVLSQNPVSIKTLKQYLSAFGSYACAEPVKKEFNRQGEDILGKMNEGTPSTHKLLSFVRYWQGMPCSESVKKDLEAVAEKELFSLTSGGNISERDIRNFMLKWEGFPAAGDAAEELEKLADEKLGQIEGIARENAKKFQLRTFISQYQGTRAARRALILYNEMIK